ncbi:MAG: hypothetical protein WBR28_01055 [Mycobacterium sp.]
MGQVQARRAKVFPSRPVLGSFVVMLVGVNPAFMACGLAYTLTFITAADPPIG